jgi:hypothetical protein
MQFATSPAGTIGLARTCILWIFFDLDNEMISARLDERFGFFN